VNNVTLRAPTFDEQIAIDDYKSAMSNALSSADTAADKIVTAGFSFATAYGAVVALVQPKGSTAPEIIAAPFAVLVLAVASALWAQSAGIAVDAQTTTADVRSRVTTAIEKKRLRNRAGLALLVVAMALAGTVLYSTYRPAASTSTTVTLWLSPTGAALVDKACNTKQASQITGRVKSLSDLSSKLVPVAVDGTGCPNGAGTLLIPQSGISVVKN
jgi:hypothetical protein